jgi:hypothetical protein
MDLRVRGGMVVTKGVWGVDVEEMRDMRDISICVYARYGRLGQDESKGYENSLVHKSGSQD